MKKLMVSLIIGVLGLAGCSSEGKETPPQPPELIYSDYYIARYVEGDMKLSYAMFLGKPVIPNKLLVTWDISKEYYNPALAELYTDYPGCLPTEPVNTAEYMQIVERNEETLHNPLGMPYMFFYNDMIALSDNFSSIHVVSNTDWDDAHPAGTYLDDLLDCTFSTFAELFESNNRPGGNGSRAYTKRMDQIGPEELRIIFYDPEGVSNVLPIAIQVSSPATLGQNHLLTVTMTTTDGRVKSARISYPSEK